MPNTSPLTVAQRRDFTDNGFLIIPDIIERSTRAALRRAFGRRVGDLLGRYQRLGIGNGGCGNFNEDLTHLLSVAPQAYQHLDISLPMVRDLNDERPAWRELFGDDWRDEAGIFADETIFHLISHPRIVAIVRQLLGEDIIASPVQHVRIKPPQRLLPEQARQDANMARTLWHQDEAVVNESAKESNILTVWIALSDATPENGCMYALAGSHHEETPADDDGLQAHCPGKGANVGEIYIPDSRVDNTRLAPLPAAAGSLILLDKRTVHGAAANTSTDVRWSFDLRYQAAGTVTGRDFYPSCPVADDTAAAYRRRWLAARDAILDGARDAVFNARWNKYGAASFCA